MNHTPSICEFISDTDINAFVWRYYIKEITQIQAHAKSHSHRPLELICVLHGQGNVEFNNGIEHIKEGQSLIITADAPHRIFKDEKNSFTVASIHFTTDVKLTEILLECDASEISQRLLGGRSYAKINENPDIGEIVKRLICELSSKEQDRDLMAKLLFSRLFLLISRYLLQNNAHSSDANANKYIQGAKNFIEDNLALPLSPASVSKALYISAGYLMHLFKDHFAMTLMEYVYFRRIEKSRMLLTETTDKITSIAPKVGIPNTQYFSVLFKKQTGMTPRDYRQNYNMVYYPD